MGGFVEAIIAGVGATAGLSAKGAAAATGVAAGAGSAAGGAAGASAVSNTATTAPALNAVQSAALGQTAAPGAGVLAPAPTTAPATAAGSGFGKQLLAGALIAGGTTGLQLGLTPEPDIPRAPTPAPNTRPSRGRRPRGIAANILAGSGGGPASASASVGKRTLGGAV